MRILQVTAVDFTVQKFVLPLIDRLTAEGNQVEIACYNGVIAEELKRTGYKVHHIPFSRNMNILRHIANVWRLVKLIKKGKYDCVHSHTPIASIIARLAAKLAGVPIKIYTAHGFYFHENMKPWAYKLGYSLEKAWARLFTDYIFFVSEEDHELAVKNNFLDSARLIYSGNGVAILRFSPGLYERSHIRTDLGLNEHDIALIYVGRLVKEKGIEELLRAFESLKLKYPNLKLMLVGGTVTGDRQSYDLDERLLNMPKHISESVLRLGLREDIPQMLCAADIFVLPSYREGLPVSVLEAMAMGKPVVATRIRGCREEVTHGSNGYLCNVKDSDDLAEKLDLLIDDEELRELYGNNSRSRFEADFTEELVMERQLRVYRRLMEEVR